LSAFPAFVDWVTIRQEWPEGGLPILNGGRAVFIDENDEVEYVVDRRAGLEGSFDSRVELRCDGRCIQFSGNIARHNRRDNLFGYDWPETIRRINSLTNLYSLPPFTSGKLFRFADRGWTWTGARVSRIDVTCNYSCGSLDGLQAVLRTLAGQHVGRQKGSLTVDGSTVEYGRGSKYVYGKCYAKHAEIRVHRSRKSGSHVAQEVVDFCEQQGILREEFTLKSRFLTQNGLSFLGSVTQGDLVDVYLARSQFRRFATVKYENFDEMPRHLRATYVSWQRGFPQGISKATFYRHRKDLLLYGVDISVPSNVEILPARVRVVDVAALEAPEWYRQRFG
jgi:hypothetical protein